MRWRTATVLLLGFNVLQIRHVGCGGTSRGDRSEGRQRSATAVLRFGGPIDGFRTPNPQSLTLRIRPFSHLADRDWMAAVDAPSDASSKDKPSRRSASRTSHPGSNANAGNHASGLPVGVVFPRRILARTDSTTAAPSRDTHRCPAQKADPRHCAGSAGTARKASPRAGSPPAKNENNETARLVFEDGAYRCLTVQRPSMPSGAAALTLPPSQSVHCAVPITLSAAR
jgi:hypothetical protein